MADLYLKIRDDNILLIKKEITFLFFLKVSYITIIIYQLLLPYNGKKELLQKSDIPGVLFFKESLLRRAKRTDCEKHSLHDEFP